MKVLTLTGRIVADAERKLSKTGKEYLSFRMANNDEKDKDGKEKPYWFGITSTKFLHLAKYLTKGKLVTVIGDYSDRIYQNQKGECEIARDIMANSIYFMPGSSESGNGDGQKTDTTTVSSPKIQTKMEEPKPTTSQIKVPQQTTVAANDDEDDLPF